MVQNQKSMAALSTTYVRAHHHTHDTPKIFDDPLASRLLTASERESLEATYLKVLARLDPTLAASSLDHRQAIANAMRMFAGPALVFARARYAEDKLAETVRTGVRQYALVGAGMETFAFRHPELNQCLQVFEVDHPAMQAFKRLRLAEVGLAPPANLHFVPVDLEQENLATALTRSAYDPHAPSFFGWLGVTMYLDRNAIFGTLRAIRSVATAGSSVVFDYFDRDAFVPAKAAKRVQATVENIRRLGEFIHTGIEPSALGTELSDIGFRLAEHLQPDEIEERYFQGRTDGYYACEHAHLAWAVVE